MVILRPTKRLSSSLPTTEPVRDRSDTALGDWYANRIVVDRQPLLLLVSSASLLPLLLPARDVRSLPGRLGALVEARLRRCGIDARAIDAEQQAMRPVVIGPTVDRSVLGIMVDFAKAVSYQLKPGRWNEDTLSLVEERLAETPCHAARSADRVIVPETKAPALLRAKWLAASPYWKPMPRSENEIALRIVVQRPPRGVRFQIQRAHGALLSPAHTTADRISFDFTLHIGPPQADGRPNLRGDFAQGPPSTRFVYVNSGVRADQKESCWDRRAKVPLGGITMEQVERALATPRSYLEAAIQGTARDGGPACATVQLLDPGWRLKTAQPSKYRRRA